MGFIFHYFLHLPSDIVFLSVCVVFQRVYHHVISVMLKVHHTTTKDVGTSGIIYHSFVFKKLHPEKYAVQLSS